MYKFIKLASFVFFVSIAFFACNNKRSESCADDCKKECCSKDEATCEPGCEKECCAKGDKKACEGDCKKECCADKKAGASEKTDSTSSIKGDEQAHVCTDACKADPESCPHHTH